MDNVNHIACQSSAFKEKIMNDFNIPREKISYLPNTIDDLFLNSTENNMTSTYSTKSRITLRFYLQVM